MTIHLRERGVDTVVLDIEGTTTPIRFVYDVLFPYARQHLAAYVAGHAGDGALDDVGRLLEREWATDLSPGDDPPDWQSGPAETLGRSIVAYATWLMDRDRKSTGLKLLQGRIWERGYADGVLRGAVFPDVPGALQRWRDSHVEVAIYSSGSVLAQKLLFGTTADGDLTRFITAFFDTGVGAKGDPDSYRRIAAKLGRRTAAILFVSDAPGEVAAAASAGMSTLLCVRPGNAPVPEPVSGPSGVVDRICSFDEIAA
ncbi:MAG TPA: acireductone synthase [Gemmatimonadaceae bacterium]|nr:acireductone synthase [Gemmatimonadaceae bacterium]